MKSSKVGCRLESLGEGISILVTLCMKAQIRQALEGDRGSGGVKKSSELCDAIYLHILDVAKTKYGVPEKPCYFKYLSNVKF